MVEQEPARDSTTTLGERVAHRGVILDPQIPLICLSRRRAPVAFYEKTRRADEDATIIAGEGNACITNCSPAIDSPQPEMVERAGRALIDAVPLPAKAILFGPGTGRRRERVCSRVSEQGSPPVSIAAQLGAQRSANASLNGLERLRLAREVLAHLALPA
jgi:hypothetical protein